MISTMIPEPWRSYLVAIGQRQSIKVNPNSRARAAAALKKSAEEIDAIRADLAKAFPKMFKEEAQ